MGDMVDDILNMVNSHLPLEIPMPENSNTASTVEKIVPYLESCDLDWEKNYAHDFKQKDDEQYLKLARNIILNRDNGDNMSEVSASTSGERKNQTNRIYQTYNFAYRPNITLPILSIRHRIVSMIASNSAVIICGYTGCGKTTQLPQLILDSEYEKNQHCKIIVTCPRRIAALSIAKRVSQEREWPVGTIVGYEMGLIKNTCEDTRITYCTTGVLLHRLINKKHMMDYTHIILDEVHERDEDMDFLLLVVKKLLRTNSMNVKVVLMSATIDTDKFAEYFSSPMGNELVPAPIINIPKGNLYNISIYYLNELENLGNIPEVSDCEPKFTALMAEFCIRLIYVFDRIDKKSNNENDVFDRPAVLIFLPGIQEIEDLRAALLTPKYENSKWDIIILHSLISTEDQENVFKKPPKGYRRIILSTNIAESSITVPDIKYVIDFCMTKLLVTNPKTNYQCLELCWASKSNCQQRAGRAGRVMNGRVYRMVPKSFYDNVLSDEALPEMLRAPLANVVLKTKLLDMGEPKAILALSLDPPNLSNLRSTILLLKEAGALMNTHDNVKEFDGDLTPLGRVMASLPLDINVSKLIVLGHIFGVLQETIIIAASMSVKDMFNIGFSELGTTYHEKLQWASNSASDSMANLNVYKVWRQEKMNGHITNFYEEKQWARRHGLRIRALREIHVLVADITAKLRFLGIKEHLCADKHSWESHLGNRSFVLKVIIAGAFYPNYFIKLPNVEHCQKDIEKILSPRDPRNTVFLRGWPLKQPGLLYAKKFQEFFAQCMRLDPDDIAVSFDGSSRVYIEYKNKDRSPDDYSFVQNAIKLRQCRLPIIIELLSEKDASNRAYELGLTDVFHHTPLKLEESSSVQYMYGERSYPELPEPDEYRSKVILQGPFSPLETYLVHLATVGTSKTISIETTSVNSVLLNTCLEYPRGLLLVSQSITQDARNESHLVLRNTTLLPNMPGLASLIILIFTPYMELRRDPLGTHYTGSLCGLGYDQSTGQSLFPEHDLDNIFDVEITIDDLRAINKLRHWMNIAMQFNDDDQDDLNELTINCQNQIKSAFTEVIYKTRKPQVPILTSNFHKWNRYDETLFLEPARETLRRNNIYSLHKALELNERNPELEDIIKHLLELEVLAYENPLEMSIQSVFCKLCQTELKGIIDLRAHLCSKDHLTKQQIIDTTSEFGEDLQSLLTKLRL